MKLFRQLIVNPGRRWGNEDNLNLDFLVQNQTFDLAGSNPLGIGFHTVDESCMLDCVTCAL
jgi:hypothetical protein